MTLQRVDATFENRGDSDWFRVRLVAGQTYQVRASSANPNIRLTVILPDGQEMHFPIPYSNYANFVAPVGGDYFISATSLGITGSYSVTVEDVVDPIPASIDTPRSLAVGETQTISGNNNSVTVNDDWFAIDLVAGQSYVLATDNITGKVYVTDGDGAVVAIEGVNGGGGQQVHFTATETGRFYAGAQHGGGTTYQLSLLSIADDHGDTPAGAGALTIGASVNGRWESAGDDDAYAVQLTAGSSYNFSVQNLDDPSVRGFIRVLDQSGSIVWTSAGQALDQSTIFSPDVDGTYYVSAGINAVGSPTNPPAYLVGWNYTLSAATVAGDLTDNALTTGVLAVGGQAAGTWEGPGDRDWLKIDLVQGQSYLFNLATSSWNGVGLALFDDQGNRVHDTTGFTPNGSYLHHTAAATGTYFISALVGQQPGSYTLSAAAVADDFANNASTTGQVVNGAGSGVSEVNGDADWFAVDLIAGQTYLLDGTAGLAMRDADGSLLTEPNWGDVSFTPTATGVYFVEAVGNGGAYAFTITADFDDYAESLATFGVIRTEILGTSGPDIFTSTDAYEYFTGDAGNDLFIAGTGFDLFDGGSGTDTVSYAGSPEAVEVDLRFALSTVDGAWRDIIFEVENVVGSAFDDVINGLSGPNSLDGGAGDDMLAGFAGNDVLVGGAGADRMDGGAGDDIFFVDDVGDRIIEAVGGGAHDYVVASVSYVLNSGAEVELISTSDNGGTASINLTGNELANILVGNAGANTLNGGAGGADTLVGLGGADTYFVDADDRVFEDADGGYDYVVARSSFVLGAGASVELMSTNDNAGTASINLTGNALANVLVGNAGSNLLDGGPGGADILVGLGGNDTYFADADDRVFEDAGGGYDYVVARSSFALGAGASVELMSTNNNAGTASINLTGNELANILVGNAGANILDGGAGGADVLQGLGGDDTYFVDADDRVFEDAGGGYDYVVARSSYALGAGASVELMSTNDNGGTAAIGLTGNELANVLVGNAGANILEGGLGNDLLVGLGGADTFRFASALGANNVDAINDFVGGTDRIALDDAVFTAIGGLGALNANAFFAGAAAHDADDRIVYNSATGQLFYDADGNGAGAAVLFATLQAGTALAASDFTVI